jgi:hypothetical protein
MPKTKHTKKKPPKRSSGRAKATRRKKPITQKTARSGKRRARASKRIGNQSKLTQAAVAIGSILGKADSAAHKAASIVKEEAVVLSDQVKDALS